ncbi:MAG TPA: ATP-dependent helicase HrpB [Gemmatimonadaceae bacterium]|nr:ATP-dependent helicase HrpB [Gemmatimonadaceae bacterium]
MTLAWSRDTPLPVDDALPALREVLASGSAAVLRAPPGAGKTTHVPLALLDEPWLHGRRVVILEPRRLAARAAARRMASLLGQEVGATVGFRVRGETRVGRATRIEVVTEGVLTRMLLADPALEGVGCVIFDEFHERSVHADLGLALALQTQEIVRPDLRLLVMSATLDGLAVTALLGDAPLVTSEGRSYPVDVRHVAMRPEVAIDAAVAGAVRRALDADEGSILAFLPGVGEIARVADRLLASSLASSVVLHPLYGDLSSRDQDAAVLPARAGTRKVVLATSIAETSLTIEGVRVVVDSGLARVSRFSPRTGMAQLETVRVSRASADQRCGRAGRTSPGVCYRLWSEQEEAALLERSTPEILMADLAPLALDLAVAGIVDPAELRWLDPPPAASLAHARELLVELEALDAEGRITAHGRRMASLGTHPRIANLLLGGVARGLGAAACALAALLEERDLFRRDALMRDADLRPRLHRLADSTAERDPRVDRERLRRVRERSGAWRSALGIRGAPVDEEAAGALLCLAYPDRVAMRRDAVGHRYLLRSGVGARLEDVGSLADASWLVVADTDGRRPEARIFLAAPVTLDDIERTFASQVVSEEVVEWQHDAGVVATRRRDRLGALVLRDAPAPEADADAVARELLAAIQRDDGVRLGWSVAAMRLRERVAFLRSLDASSWPDWSEAGLRASMDEWLLPHLVGIRRRSDVEQLDLASVLQSWLSHEQRRTLDRLAPTHVVVPTGSNVPVDYADPAAPVLAVRLQELFGQSETPRVADGRVPLTLHLLSPAGRPVQVTRDLAGFWRSSYFEVRKELRGRYPKHEWPEDPLTASPTRRAKRRGS